MFSTHLSQNYVSAWMNSLFKDHSIFRLFWSNEATVLKNKVIRGNHPTPKRCHKIASSGVKHVLNLRGQRTCGSDFLSRSTFKKVNLPYSDLAFESRNAPHKDRILRFYDFYTQQAQFPLYLHCKSGADRTGLACGLIVLFEGGTAEEALKQLDWRFLHFRSSRTGILDDFFLMYQKEGEGKSDFIDWVRNDYDEEELRKKVRPKKSLPKTLLRL